MKNEYPVSAVGMGGRQVRTGSEYGNIYDHHSVTYEFANGAKLFSNCRQQPGCRNDMSSYVLGEKGTAEVSERRLRISTNSAWTYEGKKNEFYQTEHDELFASIRKGEPINNGVYMAKSTLMAIMGRMATYTGQLITWDQAMNSGTGGACAEIIREVADEGIKVNYDAGNVMDYLDVDPIPDIQKCAAEVRSFCIKDHRNFPRDEDCGPGFGEIDHYKLLHPVAFTGLKMPLCCENIFAPAIARPTDPSGVDALARRAREFLEVVIQGLQS